MKSLRGLNKSLIEVSVVIGALVLISCSNAGLYKSQNTAASTAQINFCTTPSSAIVTNLKYLFVIDVSGSNTSNFTIAGPSATPVPDTSCIGPGNPGPCGTDPLGLRRYPALINFLNSSAQDSSIFYSALFFGTAPIIPFTNGNFPGSSSICPNGKNPPCTDIEGTLNGQPNASIWYTSGIQNTSTYMAAQYQNILTQEPASNPGGWTDYIDTVTAIQSSIVSDIQYEQSLVAKGAPIVASSYVIFWISDGFPYTATGGQSTGTILQEVQNIMNLKTSQGYSQYINSITLNTGFYTTSASNYENGQATSLMSSMAAIGQGSFINFGANTNIDYSAFAIPARNQPFVLRDFWLHDASAVWWNGQLMLDSDNDGIPDQIELQWGSNPYSYDSDGNGVGDGVEYYTYGTPCGSIPISKLGQTGQSCKPAGAVTSFVAKYTSCNTAKVPPNVTYADYDLDNLNDCEEALLGTDYTNPDSNQDWVPDQFEWLYSVPYIYGTNGLSADPANDGVTDYQKLKELFPINTPVSQIHGVNPLAYTLTQTSSNSSQTCYNVNVTSIATMSSSDVIRAYVMESPQQVSTLSRMRVLQSVTHMTGSTLSISNSQFVDAP